MISHIIIPKIWLTFECARAKIARKSWDLLNRNCWVECPKTRKNLKPDPTRIFRVFSGLTWETWKFIKPKPAWPVPEFSGLGFFPGFRVYHVGHPTNTQRGVKISRTPCCYSLRARACKLLAYASTATATAAATARRSTVSSTLRQKQQFFLHWAEREIFNSWSGWCTTTIFMQCTLFLAFFYSIAVHVHSIVNSKYHRIHSYYCNKFQSG
jgi:hypothetical protein